MVSMNDVPVNDLIDNTAEKLKKIPEIKPLPWATFVKTGMHKERPPIRADWWYVRAAAVLRSVAKLGPVGVSKLRTKYGGRKNRGHKPDKFFRGSGNILRKILQQLEKAQLVKKVEKGGRKGRILAPKGASLLSNAAFDVSKMPPKKKEEKIEAKPAHIHTHAPQEKKLEVKNPAEAMPKQEKPVHQVQPSKEGNKNE
ncbi:30S ribosomal protein S19e [Candidatus Woesearchaeota archaeon CG10_big_fil_rev_8_21_14_0_10_44_13]|nr:MAG: 30S ribosomal protein S19e [Candidatus Woesearchaeota archaeon CG10_big_fil_rev_8_21_14_0_10_44_13]